MKHPSCAFIIAMLLVSLSFFSCKEKDDDTPPLIPPVIDSVYLTEDNTQLKIYFNEAVYRAEYVNSSALTKDQLSITLAGSQAVLDSVSIEHQPGGSIAFARLYISGVINGQEVLTVKPINGTSIVNSNGAYMLDTEIKTLGLYVTTPALDYISLSGDNKYLMVYFSQGVCKAGIDTLQPITHNELSITISGGQATLDSVQVSHVGGSNEALVTLYISGVINGLEVLEVRPFDGTRIVNMDGIPMKPTELKTTPLYETGLLGKWLSTGDDLSPLFQEFNFDTVIMQFNVDGSYTYYSRSVSGNVNSVTGNFIQEKSNVTGIWTITLNQQTPVVATVEGIFSLENTSPVKMTYETAQTNPAVPGLTPPTPEAGFGSTGNFGSSNTQVYRLMR